MPRHIRTATSEDAAAVGRIYAPYVRDTAVSFEVTPPDPDEMGRRISATLGLHPYLVLEEDGEVQGYAYAGPFAARAAYRWSVEVTVYVAEARRGCGVGGALYVELLALLTRQGFHAAFAGITLPNAASVGLHERFGFVHAATFSRVGYKLGAWRDVGWWRRDLAPALPDPAEPLAFPDLVRPRGGVITPPLERRLSRRR